MGWWGLAANWGDTRERKRHINVFHINFLCRPSSPGSSQGQTGFVPGTNPVKSGLSLCKIRRNPGFVPCFHRLCPRDEPGEIPGQTRGRPKTNRTKKSMFMFATLRAWYRLQKLLHPENPKKLRKKYKIPLPGLGPENTKKLPKKYKNCDFWAILIFFRHFSYFRAPTREGGFCIFFVIFSYFRDSGVFVICTRPAGSQVYAPFSCLGHSFVGIVPQEEIFFTLLLQPSGPCKQQPRAKITSLAAI